MSTNLVDMAKNLRKRSTDAENLLWRHLRAKQLEGFKFRRQQPLGNYIVDFVCFKKMIIIELDGGQHAIEKEKDNERDTLPLIPSHQGRGEEFLARGRGERCKL